MLHPMLLVPCPPKSALVVRLNQLWVEDEPSISISTSLTSAPYGRVTPGVSASPFVLNTCVKVEDPSENWVSVTADANGKVVENRKVATIKMAIFRISFTAPPTVGYADTRRLRLSNYSGPVRARSRRTLNSAKMFGGLGQVTFLVRSW